MMMMTYIPNLPYLSKLIECIQEKLKTIKNKLEAHLIADSCGSALSELLIRRSW